MIRSWVTSVSSLFHQRIKDDFLFLWLFVKKKNLTFGAKKKKPHGSLGGSWSFIYSPKPAQAMRLLPLAQRGTPIYKNPCRGCLAM